MYNGTQKKLALNRKELCTACEGRGGSVSRLDGNVSLLTGIVKGARRACPHCNGIGTVYRQMQIGDQIQVVQGSVNNCKIENQNKSSKFLSRLYIDDNTDSSIKLHFPVL